MRRFWLCIFLVTCISAFAASYGSENIKSDAVTSATEYTGIPKKFKNGKVVDEQSAQISTEEQQKPKIVLPKRTDDESLRTESVMRELPETFEEEKPTIVLPGENLDNEYSKTNSEMQELPETFEEEKPTIVLPDENLDNEYSRTNSEMQELPETFEEEKPTIVLPDENLDNEYSKTNSRMQELPLPSALFEEDEEKDEDLPFIWDEDSQEEKSEQDEFHDEDLPTLLDVPEVTLDKIEKSETFDVPEIKVLQDFVEPNENEYNEIDNFAESSKDFDDANKSADLETEIEWVFQKDSRKLMDFNENFDGFPKSDNDVFDNPAQYQYDNENLVVESSRKIDNLTGSQLFDSAVKYIKANENAKAAKLLKELLHYNFNVPETEYLLALADFKNGNSDEAIKYLNRSFRKNKNPYLLAKNMELLGEINFSQKKYDEAYQNFISAIVGVNAKLDAQLYNKAGIAALRAGDIEKARKAWETGKYLGNRNAEHNLLWLDN